MREKTKKCVSCGAELPEDAAFCPFCTKEQIEKMHIEPPTPRRKKKFLASVFLMAVAVFLALGIWYLGGANNEQNALAEVPTTQPSVKPSPELIPTPTPTPTPTSTPTPMLEPSSVLMSESFPIDTPVWLEFDVKYDRGEGITFTKLSAEKSADGIVRFTVYFTSDRTFYVSAFEPPGGDGYKYLDRRGGPVTAESTFYSFTATQSDLESIGRVTISFYTDGNLNFIVLNRKVITWICS